MKNVRFIARLDVKGTHLIKGIHLEGLRKLGDPNEFAYRYYTEGIDELIYMDVVASLFQRDNLLNIVRKTTENVFVPITVGGGIRSLGDVEDVLRAGADKIAINTAAIDNPLLIREVASRFGSQCMVLSIEAKKTGDLKWEAYCDNGREKSGYDVVEWAKRGCELGAGEILLTSVDKEGTRQGFDCDLVRLVTDSVPIPVIACGGLGTLDHLGEVLRLGDADAVAIASVLHYNKLSIQQIKSFFASIKTAEESL